jgi:hypothetical protein
MILALLAGNLLDLTNNLGIVEKWAKQWEMYFGVAKCGLMVIGGSQGDHEALATAALKLDGANHPSHATIHLPWSAD